MIVACLNAYNDWPLIKRCVSSVYDKVDRIVAIDGRYAAFPGGVDYSTDGTAEYLEGLDKVDLYCAAGLDELGKRNTYLKHVHPGDTVFNIDADEELKGNFSKLDTDFGIIKLKDGKHIQDRATRYFKYREGMFYRLVHYTLYWQDRQVNNLKRIINDEFTYSYVDSFYLEHHWQLRDELRKHYKSIYYKKLVRAEAGFPR